jgi:GWxTD domain-containing protein
MKTVKFTALGLIALWTMACGMNSLPSKDPWYAMHFFIMQDFERDSYRSMSGNGRLEFQKVFWAERKPELKAEFDKRMDYIDKNFRKENSKQPWNTDRSRVYLLNGSPASIEYKQNDAWTMQAVSGGIGASGVTDRTGEDIQANTLEVWAYPYDRQLIFYAFVFQPPNKWKAGTMAAGGARYIGQLEAYSKSQFWVAMDPEGYLRKLDELKAVK